MDSEEEKDKGFKVEDRRRFSSEGELKPEHRGTEEPAEPEPPIGGPAAQTAAGSPGTFGTQTAAQESHAAEAFSRRREAAGEINFGTFVVGLSTQALMHLGEIPDPQTNQAAPDLLAAQQLIDIIAMLKDKTRGNLEQEELAMLDAIL
ncbi:MAG TPA: DUF1844 domain-containing protein, partial [Candidatus Binataceae bacterium]|nr:DUF1844 domain-containing protein [Candidatus Binataceae bacterium]